jgi:predicted amidohydrolase
MRAGLIQMTSGDVVADNLEQTRALFSQAVADGADLILTPEVTNCLSGSRAQQVTQLTTQDADPTLSMVREFATKHNVWVLIGSLALKTEDADGRFANRSFLIDASGNINAWYDKIHMFDVQVSATETYRESKGYRPGDRAVLADTPFGKIGMSICYDLRFPHLYRDLALAGADILTVPSAFSQATGPGHWEALLRARAIETGCFVLAPAQTGTHPSQTDRVRKTHGHSLVIDPWGTVLSDAGTQPGVSFADLDMSAVAQTRQKLPSLSGIRPYGAPL